jgi:hypothetical protein
MRRPRSSANHGAPYIEDILAAAVPHLAVCRDLQLGHGGISIGVSTALTELWSILGELSLEGRARGGRCGAVGISKATMLLSFGTIGPAFDSVVRKSLGIARMDNAAAWIDAISFVDDDISRFQNSHSIALNEVAPDFSYLGAGRLYDMALGPR